MAVKKEKYCSVCFRAAENEYEIIDDCTDSMLRSLTIELDWNFGEELLLCQECAEILKKSYNFKLVCSDTINRYDVKVERNGLEMTESSKRTETKILEEYSTCSLCMNDTKSDTTISIDDLLSDPNIMELYLRCMADIDLDIKGAMICLQCRENFEAYFNFVRSYLNVKETINAYIRNESFDGNMGQIKLKKIHQFLFPTTTELPHVSTEIKEIKQEQDKFEDYDHFEVQCKSLKLEDEIDIKNETIIVNRDENQSSSNEHVFISTIHSLEMQSHTLNHILKIPCAILNKNKKVKTYNCTRCTFETKHKSAFRKHNLTHKNIFKIKMYKCESCNYETKYKGNFKYHILTHKDISEVKMYKCNSCTFETKHEYTLKRHVLCHEGISMVYKCENCIFETKNKYYLKRHVLLHSDDSEINMYKCASCTYESKNKGDLKRHILTHKDISEVEMYKCESCSFETKHKNCLKRHSLIHEDISEVETYKCENCTFKTKRKHLLKIHNQIHKSNYKAKMYKCDSCTFETRRRSNFKSHIIIHKSSSEVDMYKCERCTFETKRKGCLKRHNLTHKDISEVETYKCEHCIFETRYKDYLKHHALIHKDISEVETYKCERCSFETKYKRDLKRHILTHKVTNGQN